MSKPAKPKTVKQVDYHGLPYGLEGFQLFCSTLTSPEGQPFVLEEHEVEIVRDHFAGALRVIVVIGKKNGKTTLFAALALYHLEMVPNAKVLVAAASRDQATIMFGQSEALVIASSLEHIFKAQSGYRRIRMRNGRPGEYRVLAGDVDTADGQIPTLALVDELHRHRSDAMMNALFLGMGPVNGRMIVISTAGDNLDSALGRKRVEAHAYPVFKRDYERKKNVARSEDGALVWHEWCLDSDDDVHDMAVVKKVNPASWHTLESLSREQGGVSAGDWKRLRCGIWTEGENAWLEPEVWDGLAEPGLTVTEKDDPVWIGVSSSGMEQDAGIVLLARRGTMYAAEGVVVHPPFKREAIERQVIELAERFRSRKVAYTKKNFERSGELLEEALGTDAVFEFPLVNERLTNGSATLLQVIEAGRLRHNGAGDFRAHVMAGERKTDEFGWRIQKTRWNSNVAGLMALLAVVRVAEYDAADSEPMFAFG